MSQYIKMFFSGTEAMFDIGLNNIDRKKNLVAKNELRIMKVRLKSSVLTRSSNRIKKIKTEVLS